MQINVLRELKQPVGAVAVLDVSEPKVRVADTEIRDLEGSLTLLRTDRGLLASFDARATVGERCARCLIPVDCPIRVRFEEEYVPIVDANTGRRLGGVAQEEGFTIGVDFVLDLREPLRQYVLMSEPLKPLCRPDCAGLCPTCGEDLNSGPCGCPTDVDERWHALAGFDANRTKGK